MPALRRPGSPLGDRNTASNSRKASRPTVASTSAGTSPAARSAATGSAARQPRIASPSNPARTAALTGENRSRESIQRDGVVSVPARNPRGSSSKGTNRWPVLRVRVCGMPARRSFAWRIPTSVPAVPSAGSSRYRPSRRVSVASAHSEDPGSQRRPRTIKSRSRCPVSRRIPRRTPGPNALACRQACRTRPSAGP